MILGEVHVGAGAILAQGLVVRAHGAAVSIGNHSAILENWVVIGTPEHPVRPCAGSNADRNGREKTLQQPKAPLLDQALSSSRTCM